MALGMQVISQQITRVHNNTFIIDGISRITGDVPSYSVVLDWNSLEVVTGLIIAICSWRLSKIGDSEVLVISMLPSTSSVIWGLNHWLEDLLDFMEGESRRGSTATTSSFLKSGGTGIFRLSSGSRTVCLGTLRIEALHPRCVAPLLQFQNHMESVHLW